MGPAQALGLTTSLARGGRSWSLGGVDLPLALAYPALTWERLRGRGPALTLADLPPGHARLPDLLALAGVRTLLVAGAPDGVWHGPGGRAVTLNRGGPALTGELPGCQRAEPASDARAELTRTEAVARALAARRLPLPMEPSAAGEPAWPGALNPFPLARFGVVELSPPPGPTAVVGAVRDDAGALHPVQLVHDEPAGERWITALALQPLQATSLRPIADAPAACHWEVSPRVLDQGRVRGEFDRAGRLERLSWDGVFAPWRAPACRLSDGQGRELALRGIRVREAGPVRSVLAVSFDEGVLEYVLLARESAMEVRWTPAATAPAGLGLRCELPLEGTQPPLLGDGLAVRATAGPGEHQGVSWALGGGGSALGGARALALQLDQPGAVLLERSQAGLSVRLDGATRLRLQAAARLPDGLGLPFAGHRPWPGAGLPGLFRWLGPPEVAVLAARLGPEGAVELVLAEIAGVRSRCTLFPRIRPKPGAPAPLPAAQKVDALGAVLEAVRPTADGDGYQVQLAAHEIAILRWTPGG